MEYEINPRSKLHLGIAELWQYRELFYFFTWRDLKVKYKQTLIGLGWIIFQPLILMIVFTFSIGKLITVQTGEIPYPLFVYSGLILWNLFSSGLTSAGNSMVNNASIIKKIYFPRLIIPVSSVLVSLVDFLVSALLLVALIIYYNAGVNLLSMIWCVPASLLIATIATTGLGCWLSALNIKYRDFRYIIPFLIQFLLFVSPVIYPLTIFKNKTLQYLLSLNPMYSPVELFRLMFHGSNSEPVFLLLSTLSSVTVFITGIYYFRKTESYFADLA